MREHLWRVLEAERVDRPPMTGPVGKSPNVRWVKPALVAEVEFSEWTTDGRLRHPVFRGLRPDKRPKDCIREVPE